MRLEFGSSSATTSGDIDDHRRIFNKQQARVKFLRNLAYWNFVSLVLFLFACGVSDAQSIRPTTIMSRTTSYSKTTKKNSSSIEFLLLINSNNRTRRGSHRQCKPFDERAIDELCKSQGFSRITELRDSYLFPTCDDAGELSLFNFFGLQTSNDNDLGDPMKRGHLDPALENCFLYDATDDECRNCYRNLSTRILDVVNLYELFSNKVLSKLDCEPDDDLQSYSAIFNCSLCKIWYKRWLLITMKGVWKRGPCVEWCHLAELACPHLQASRKDDYAGLPSFRCTDATIPNPITSQSISSKQQCVHPCGTWAKNDDDKKEYFRKYCNKYDRPTKKSYTKKKRKHFEASSSGGPSDSVSLRPWLRFTTTTTTTLLILYVTLRRS